MSVHQLCFPSQVRIHPQIRSQITRLQSKYSLDLDPHTGVTQPKLSRATQTTNSLLSKPSSTPLCVQNILGLASLNTEIPSLSLEIPLSALSHCCHVTQLGFPVYFPPNPPRQGAAGDSTPQGPTMCSKFCPLAARRGCRSFHIDFLPAASQPLPSPPQPNRSLNGGP